MKVAELTGAELDLWVARANAPKKDDCLIPGPAYDPLIMNGRCFTSSSSPYSQFSPSTNWAHGGPIIERERIHVTPLVHNIVLLGEESGKWTAKIHAVTPAMSLFYGDTPLEVAMRAYVASRYGDTVPPLATEQEEK